MLHSNLGINDAGHLTLGGMDTVALAKKHGTPLYLMDEQRIRENCSLYRETMRQYFPEGSCPLLASKALCCREIYRIAASEGMGTDIVSSGELYTALSAGFDPKKMFLHGNAKTGQFIRYGIESGVGYFVVDNTRDAERINSIAEELGVIQPVLLRITPGVDPHTFDAVKTGHTDSKFGAAIETGSAAGLTGLCRTLPNLRLDGYHCHIGSQIFESPAFLKTVDVVFDFLNSIRSETGYIARILNLGGGFAVRYTEEDPVIDRAALIAQIADRIKEKCCQYDFPEPIVYLEPGRSIVADAGLTLYTVQSIKSIADRKTYVAVDGGMTDNPRFALYQSRYTALVANRAVPQEDCVVSLAGCCCESGDMIGVDMVMNRPEVGDTIAVLVTGAYNYSMASNYNRIPRPPVVMIRDGADRVVVRRETLEDLVACDL